MKTHNVLGLALLSCFSAAAQPQFSASTLPSQTGQYFRSYYSTNVNVASMLALTNASGGPPPPPSLTNSQLWDFSWAQRPGETILRTDIVPVNDGGNDGGSFPGATYAERDTLGTSQIAWRYFSIDANVGREYYGFYNPVDQNADYLVQFYQPTVDIPHSVQYGQTWNRTVNWSGLVLGSIPINYYFSASAAVDAYGTMALPNLGHVSALRVHEVHAYRADWVLLGGPPTTVDIHTNQYYYWLVPGLGVAVQVFQFGDNTLYPAGLPNSNTVLRAFEANYPTNVPPATTASWLQIRLQNGTNQLHWQQVSNASSYRIDWLGSLAFTNWQTLGLTTNTNYSDALGTTQRFYRVVPQP